MRPPHSAARIGALIMTLTTTSLPVQAQPGPPVFRATAITAPAEPDAIPLRPGPATTPEHWNDLGGQRIVRNVSQPVLLPVRPAPGQGNGRAVLVLPGGGYQFLSIDNEGLLVARRLAAAGYSAYVLKYRVRPTPAEPQAFADALNAEVRQMISLPPERRGRLEPWPAAVEDAQAAMRLLRERAAEQGHRADRVAGIGFSAGARTAAALVEAGQPGTVPDALALIYGSMRSLDTRAALPPLFVALADDDPIFGREGFGLIERWRQAGQRVEMHLYERGSHGFGLVPRGTTSDHWIDAYLAWLARQ